MVPWVPHSQHPGFGPLGLQHKNSETAAALRQFVVSNRAKPPGPFEAAAPTLTSLSPDSMWPENWSYRNYYLALAHLYLIRQPCLCWVQSTHTGINATTGSCPRIPCGRSTFQRLKWKETRGGPVYPSWTPICSSSLLTFKVTFSGSIHLKLCKAHTMKQECSSPLPHSGQG